MELKDRLENYHRETGYPPSLFIGGDGRLLGIWIMGNNYTVKSGYYGGYPAGYLKRVKAMFPEKNRVLHLFSGKVDTAIFKGKRIDINEENHPDVIGDAHELSKYFGEDFDLILADPPYSVEDCEHYGTSMISRNKVLEECYKVLEPGGHVVWLDQVLPMYSKLKLQPVGFIGMVKSTNHRFRIITIFEKQKTTSPKETKPENAKRKCSHIWTGNKETGRFCKWCGKGGVIRETKPENAKLDYCPNCNQMTNQSDGQCLRCDSMNKTKEKKVKR
jgi:hypothetical protein